VGCQQRAQSYGGADLIHVLELAAGDLADQGGVIVGRQLGDLAGIAGLELAGGDATGYRGAGGAVASGTGYTTDYRPPCANEGLIRKRPSRPRSTLLSEN
jgi:hypothetical protein